MRLNEKLSSLYEYDKEFFEYTHVMKDAWNDLIRKAQERFKIAFDLENNDTMHQQKEIIVPQNEWKPEICKFKCELFRAGGDWEVPIFYFRCQIVSGYAFEINTYRNPLFIYIPGKKEGNYSLVRTNKGDGWTAVTDENYTDGIDPENNDKDCWKSLEKYLKALVDMEIEDIKQRNKETT